MKKFVKNRKKKWKNKHILNLKYYCVILSYNDIIRISTKEKPMGTEKKFKTKAVFFVVLAAIMIILQLPQQVCATEQKDTIVVGTNAEYAPFEYLDSNGNLTGFDIDLMNAIAKEENVNIKWVDLPFDSLMGQLKQGILKQLQHLLLRQKNELRVLIFQTFIIQDLKVLYIEQEMNTQIFLS